MFQTADESLFGTYVMQCDHFSWVVFSGPLELPQSWSCVMTISNMSKAEFKTKYVVASSINGWMNEELTVSWVKGALGNFSFTRRMLAWDSFWCHVLDSVKQELNRGKIDPEIVPRGCKKYIQAPDVSWNKPFKTKVTEKYDEWIRNVYTEFLSATRTRGSLCI